MTPAQKAKELVDKYYKLAESIDWTDNETKLKAEKLNDELGTDVLKYWNELAKSSALFAVDQILNLCWGGNKVGMKHWQEVKQEIEKL